MKIAIVSTMDESAWGGSEELWSQMAEAALAEGHQVYTLTSFWPEVPDRIHRLESQGASVAFQMQLSRLPTIWQRRYRRLLNLGNMLRGRNRFKYFDLLNRWQPDVVCVSMGHIYEFLRHPGLVKFLETTSVPFLLLGQYVDDVRIPPGARISLISRIFKRASRVVFVSQRNQLDVERQLARRISNAQVVQNPVNLSDVSIVPWPTQEHVSLAIVSRLSVLAKGQDLLLEALSRPAWRERVWTLNVYGEGADREYLQALVEFYGLADQVRFHGHVDDIRQVWAANHLLVMPSRGEGTPLALVEAQLCGHPAVVTDVGGNAEWVEDGVTGFIADGPYGRVVGAALDRAWERRAEWEAMGGRAHQEAINKIDRHPEQTLFSLVISTADRQRS